MHSRIIQISNSPKFDIADNADIPEWFIERIADYAEIIDDDEQLLQEQWDFLKRLNEAYKIEIDDNLLTFTITKENINKYFKRKYEVFMNIISVINKDVDIANFTGECLTECDLYNTGKKSKHTIGEILYLMNSAFNDKYDIYIFQSEYNNLLTLDEYMRELMCNLNTFGKKEETLYVGSVYDYHY